MICDRCSQPGIEWVGDLAAPIGTKCPHCGGMDCQRAEPPREPDEGDPCREDGCIGHVTFQPDGDCACHISPPCSGCVDAPLRCDVCGERA